LNYRYVKSSIAITNTSWHHVVLTRTGSELKIYVDAVDVTTVWFGLGTLSALDTGTPLLLGYSDYYPEYAGYPFKGSLDEVRVYNRVLTADEITALYAAPWPLWAGATDAGNGWSYLNWFGYFKNIGGGWIYHAEHGWMYCIGDSPSSIWMWMPMRGWMWSSASLYPFLWSDFLHTWLWYYRDTGNGSGGWFYNYGTGHTEWR
jgi:hypothetical protein